MKKETLVAIKAAKTRRENAMQCTKDNPMPHDRDQMGQAWFHVDAKRKAGEPVPRKAGDSSILVCPNCGIEFRTTLKEIK